MARSFLICVELLLRQVEVVEHTVEPIVADLATITQADRLVALGAQHTRAHLSGYLVSTLLYFVLFNLGLIALLTRLPVDARIRSLDWPVLVGVTWLATVFFARGRVGRAEGAVLLALYVAYVAVHVVLG